MDRLAPGNAGDVEVLLRANLDYEVTDELRVDTATRTRVDSNSKSEGYGGPLVALLNECRLPGQQNDS
jgi:hypothetical protein